MKLKYYCIIVLSFVILIGLSFFANESYAYKIDEDQEKPIIYGVVPNTDVTDFLTNVDGDVRTRNTDQIDLYEFKNNSFQKVTDGIVKTEMYLLKNELESSTPTALRAEEIYKVSVVGDINKDGISNQIDLSALIRHYVGLSGYVITDDAVLKAANPYEDNTVNILDVSYLIKYNVEGEFPTIERESYNINLSETSGETSCPNTKTFTITNPSGGKIKVSSADEGIATASVSDNVVTVTPVAQGTTQITVHSEETIKYEEATATYTIVVNKGIGYIALSKTWDNVVVGGTTTVNVTRNHGNTTQIHVLDSSVATANISNGVITVRGIGMGSTTIIVTAPENNSYTEASTTYTIIVSKPITYSDSTTGLVGGKESLKDDYGKSVASSFFTSNESTDWEWQLFYDDEDYIFLIASDYVPNRTLPMYGNTGFNSTVGNLYKPTGQYVTNANYNAIFCTTENYNDYVLASGSPYLAGSAATSIQNNPLTTKYLKYVASYPDSTRVNIQCTAFMMDTTKWKQYAGNKYAGTFAIGGPTVELYAASYNAYPNHTTRVTPTISANGYSASGGAEGGTNMWHIDDYNSKAYQYYLASPHYAWDYPALCTVGYTGVSPNDAAFKRMGFRPMVVIPKASI